jgi:hypothetical protein
MQTTLAKAIARYFQVCGANALQPSQALSTVSRNRTAFLRSVSGSLAVVTANGSVFDRIGGTRLNEAGQCEENHTAQKADRTAELRVAVDNSLRICQLEMLKAAPNLDYAYDFAYKAMRSIETLRIMTIGGGAV